LIFVCYFFPPYQIRTTDDKFAGGHAGGHTHGSCFSRCPGSEAMAVRRLLQGCGIGEQNGKQWNAGVRPYGKEEKYA